MKKIFFLALSVVLIINAEDKKNDNIYLTPAKKFKYKEKITPLFLQVKTDANYAINNSESYGIKASTEAPIFDWNIGLFLESSFLIKDTNLVLNGYFLITNSKDHIKQNVTNQFNYGEPFDNKGIIPSFMYPNAFLNHQQNIRYENGFAKYDIDLYNLNIAIKNSFYLTKNIITSFLFGIKNTYIFQTYKIKYQNGKTFPISLIQNLTPIQTNVLLKNNSIAVGPLFGFDIKWYFIKNVNLFSELLGSIQYTYFYTKREDKNIFFLNSYSLEEYKTKNNFSSYKPSFDIKIGLSYEKDIENIKFNLDFAYFFNFFYKPTHLIHYANTSEQTLLKTDSNLSIKGFLIETGVSF